MDETTPQITIGMPVYNGAKELSRAIDNILGQSFQDFQIIISNNGSTDDTARICDEYAAKDSRIVVYHQSVTSNPTANFCFVRDKAKTPYFMWCAHDDTHDPDFIEKMVSVLRVHEKAVLAFGDVLQVRAQGNEPFVPVLARNDRGALMRMSWCAGHTLHHLYGVWRTEDLQRIDWRHADWTHDLPLMLAAEVLGDIVYVPGVRLHYCDNRHPFFKGGMSAGLLLKKSQDVAMLVLRSYQAVASIRGPFLGVAGGGIAFARVVFHALRFVGKRICFFLKRYIKD